MAGGVLLDTCAVIWLANGAPMAPAALQAISEAAARGGVFISPISAWEIGMLSRPGRAQSIEFKPDPARWFTRLMAGPGIKPAPFNGAIAIAASYLPEPFHADPADRLLIATARHLGLPLITRDSKIIAYGEVGGLGVITC
jgi:PIN domain nuclease of toxin-antitoxin system